MKKCLTNLYYLGIILLCCVFTVQAQKAEITKVNPTNWFVGMKNPNLQILIYGKNLQSNKLSLKPHAGVKLKKVHTVENPNYLFVDLEIAKNTKAGNLQFSCNGTSFSYELKAKSAQPRGLSQADFIYLLMPDRFANGDYSNDKFADMADPNHDRKNPFFRHGGDLQGVTQHLDYLKELGVTAIWMTPVIENNQYLTDEGGAMRSAYHGYGFTEHYNVDKRLGGNEAYKKLSNEAHKKGIKLVQDAVYNHVGINHWFLKDMPSKDWLNQWDKYTNTTYKDQPLFDIHASAKDTKEVRNGWFTSFLPDLNQNNPFVANFLIQHALWSVETFDLDAWRIDTYIYNDLYFMNKCNQALLTEYPKIHIFGESAVNTVISQAYFTKNNLAIPFKSNLPGALDFVVEEAIFEALNHDFGWNDGVSRLYSVLAQDLAYADPSKNVNFLENHDHHRFFSVIGEDFEKYKMGIAWLMTLRGIPHFYYGTEILMKNFKNPSDAEVRRDFPGGWKEDEVNKFEKSGRNEKENEAFEFVKKLANFRKSSDAIANGKFMQFVPQDAVYVYFRHTEKQIIMVVSNTSKSEKNIDTSRFEEILKGSKSAKNIIDDVNIADISNLKIPAKGVMILEINQSKK
ncbi:glycoside hydrolase family 13 protein [Lacihabitans soyangensis]|uniref:Alpha-amylase n=1 Tax=Lacihabitans soyangensis TaxID=869394 RepID=A0AAE3KVT2_9BACT|nr:glycoside hydrolase family 13 protein [Lacihabitans soyangensis]MCP9764556.1 alpha-amylase [Lacihabitans soyangensis]